MFTFLYCGLPLLSNIVIPELPEFSHDDGEFLFNLDKAKLQSSNITWYYHWVSLSGEPLLSYRAQNTFHWLRFPGKADFRISENAREITCYPQPEIPLRTIRHLLLDQVLPRCLAHRGFLVLHASAVRVQNRVVIFIGESGTGKSTLAGDFHQAGMQSISDDCVLVKETKAQITAVPSYGGLRLWEDSFRVLFAPEENAQSVDRYSAKKQAPINNQGLHQSGEAKPILAIILLTQPRQTTDREIRIDQLPPREAFVEIGRRSFQLYLSDTEEISRHMQALGRIVTRLPIYRLSMPYDYDLLPLVRQKILEAVL